MAIILLVVICGAFGTIIAPNSPRLGSLDNTMLPPFWAAGGRLDFPLGTDFQGRDVLSRIIVGARVSLIVLIFGTLGAGALGSFLGLLSGFAGGWADKVIMRIVDMTLSFPPILVALMFAAVFGASIMNVTIIVILTSWVRYARQVRGEVLSLKEREFVLAATAIGASNFRIMTRHLAPNVFATIIVLATFSSAGIILLEASLSFLGVGIPPPNPSWGIMISDGRQWITIAWWISVMPGIAIAGLILSLNLLGDWLRDYLDPSLRGRG